MSKGIWGRLTSRVQAPKPGTPVFKAWNQVTRANVWLYRASGGRIGGKYDTAPVCILHHTGAKSGVVRETPLVYMPDGENVVIVASMGGNPKNPAWYHNLKAHPATTVEVRGTRKPVTARFVDDEPERSALWSRLLQIWPAWEDYQARTTRRLPVIVLEPR